MPATTDVLDHFHPGIRAWFSAAHPAPTTVQSLSWPVIAAGRHVLITAPTGSGKTLTAFLWSINRFATGQSQTGRTRVLYISPLKALNNDIRVNLTEPLQALQSRHGVPAIRVAVRSGDTSASDRQRLLRQPPDVLITTPESLHLMLTTARGRQALSTVECLIVDEIHALVGNRRGAQLSVAMERLALVAGEFQRIALSATVHPLTEVAAWVAGRDPDGRDREVTTIHADTAKRIDFRVRFPVEAQHAAAAGQKIWEPLSERFRDIIQANRSTLFFTNSRRLAEKITLKINEKSEQPVAYAHHGSLSREIRTDVEQRLKAGELRAIVATNSLEMGIDIGALDEVVMVQSPPSIAQTLQRIGRAGHAVGATSVGTLFPSHSRDLLHAAVLADAVQARDLEPIHLIRNPLDTLVQIIISCGATQAWTQDDLYDLCTRSYAYRTLSRDLFDLVIDMLSGRFAGARLRELKPRIIVNHDSGTITVARGALHAMYASGGNIPDRGYYTLRSMDGGAVIGELDEEFVWEATLGQSFTLGTQAWTIQRITHNDVLVTPARTGAQGLPFWRSETQLRGNHLSERIGTFLMEAERQIDSRRSEGLRAELASRGFDEGGVDALTEFLDRQRRATGAPLPHRHHLLVEQAAGGPDGYRGPDAPRQLILHTLWGGALNQPFAMALRAALEQDGMERPQVHSDDDAVVIQCRDWPDTAAVLGLVTADNVDALLRRSLEGSGLFGARFRECAQRSLLLAKPRFNQRLPLWMSRQHAKKLLTTVKRYEDFPALLETWRTCLQDEFDLPALRNRLRELESGECAWSCVATAGPSPFASSVRFEQINPLMYATDDPEDPSASGLSGDLIASAVENADLRPVLQPETITAFEAKRQRLAAGYSPAATDDLVEWVRERVLLTDAEWSALLGASGQMVNSHPDLQWIERDRRRWITHREHAPYFLPALFQQRGAQDDAAYAADAKARLQRCIEVLSFHGPLSRERITALLPVVPEALWSDTRLIPDVCVAGAAEPQYCDRDNLEILFRLQRSRQRNPIEPRPFKTLPLFLAGLHNLGRRPVTDAGQLRLDLVGAFARLSGFSASVHVWLQDLLPARTGSHAEHHVADVFNTEGFCWRGTGPERVMVATLDEAPLLATTEPPDPETAALMAAFRDPAARYAFQQIRDQAGAASTDFNDIWWRAVWGGWLAADDWQSLQQADRRNFRLGDASTVAAAAPSTLRRRMRSVAAGWPGNWHINPPAQAEGPAQRMEAARARVRILLDRYGVLCRELVIREGLAWGECFRALRIMELAGEVVGGLFFDGLGGPQFAAPAAVHRLRDRTTDRSWWVNATDCASPCGLGLDWPELPQRRPGNFLAFVHGELVLVVENAGKQLRFLIPEDHPHIDDGLEVLCHMARHDRHLEVNRINGVDALVSPYLLSLDRVLRVQRTHKSVELEPRERAD